MASFWKRRKNTMSTATTEYNQPAPSTRKRNIVTSILGIIIIGILFFGVFSAARWSFEKLSDSGSEPATVSTTESPQSAPPSTSSGTPPVTVTSSTSTTTPSSSTTASTSSTTTTPTTTTTTASTTTNLPYTGPESIVPFFFGTLVVSYLLYRKKLVLSAKR